MRILHVITSLITAGAEKVVTELTVGLNKKGIKADVCVFDGTDYPFKKHLQEHGYNVITLGKSYYSPMHIFCLRKIMQNYDIVHTHNTSPQFYAAIAKATMSKDIKLVTTEHSTCNRRRDWKWYAPIDKWMYRKYERVICISEQAEENLRNHIGVRHGGENDNICTIYNGVDVEAINHSEPLDDVHSDKFVVVMVAGFRYQKDQDTIIRGMSLLPKSEYELWLVGEGERRELLEKLAHECGVWDQVKFLGLRSDVPRILKTADVVVMSSHFEGLSLSNIEGMAAGKPFVASDVDGLREVTKDYGLLFPHGDFESFATVIRNLHDDRDLYEMVSGRCYARAKEYDVSHMVDNYMKVYQNLLKEKQ